MQRDDQVPVATMVRSIGAPPGDEEILKRLAGNPRDAEALVALYENHGKQLRQAAARWFGRKAETCNRAINSILVSIGRKAATYDARSEDATHWIGRCADAEAKRLREARDTVASRSLRSRGSV